CLSLSRLVSTPLILTMPDVGVSMHPIMLRMVDLPDPEGPVIEMNSPFSYRKGDAPDSVHLRLPQRVHFGHVDQFDDYLLVIHDVAPAFIQQRRITKLKIWTSC